MIEGNGTAVVVEAVRARTDAPLACPVQIISEDRAVQLNLRVQDPGVYDFFADRPAEEHERLAHQTIRMGVQVLGYADAVGGADYVDRKFQGVVHDMGEALMDTRAQIAATIKQAVDPAQPGSYTGQLKALGKQTEERVKLALDGAKVGIDTRMATVTEFIRQNLDPKLADSYVGQMKAHVEGVKAELDRLFDPTRDGSYLRTLRQEIEGYFGDNGKLAAVLAAALSLDTEGSPLARLRSDMERNISGLRADIRAQQPIQDVRDQTTLKGEDFEARCLPIIHRMIVNGDTLDDVRSTAGLLPRVKKGDFTIDVNADDRLRIVIEAKNQQSLTARGICDELDEAKRNRCAGFGIFLLASGDLLPGGCEPWQLFGEDKVVCILDETGRDLKLAYQWARSQLLARHAETAGVDTTAIRKHLKKAKDAVDRLSALRTKTSTVKKGIEEIDKVAQECQDIATAELAAIERTLSDSTDAAG